MNETVENQDKLWHKSFVFLFILNFCQFISFHMQVATFSFFIKDLGGSDVIAGLASGMFSIASLITRPISGWIFDQYSKKVVLFAGLIGMLLLPLAYTALHIIALLLFLRLLHGIFWSMSSTAVNSEVVGIIPRKRFGEGMGYFGVTAALSMSISPAVGLALMDQYGFTLMFFAAAFMAAVALVLSFVYGIGSNTHSKPSIKHTGFFGILSNLFSKEAIPASVIIFLCLIPYGAIMTFVALYAVENNIGDGGGFFMVMAATTILMRIIVGKISDRQGEGIVVYASAACIALCTLLLGLFPHFLTFYGAALCFGAGFGMITPAMQAMALRIASPETRGAATSTYLCAFDLGIGSGGIIGGLLVKAFGNYAHMYLILFFAAFLAAVFYYFWGSKSPSAFRNTVQPKNRSDKTTYQ